MHFMKLWDLRSMVSVFGWGWSEEHSRGAGKNFPTSRKTGEKWGTPVSDLLEQRD